MKLQITDASVGYDKNAPLQRHVDFSVQSGEVCCVLGPNGCGKTTLVRTILGMQPLLAGAITMDGSDVTRWSASKLADAVAYVAQRHDRTFPFTVREVVLMGRINRVGGATDQPGPDDYAVVDNAMNDMGIWHLRDEPYSDVSGGELQMVMFARALAQEPRMLVLDEPTAALDYGNAVRVISKVRKLARMGYGVLMITHNPDHAFMCGANVALFTKRAPMRFGEAEQIITRRNIKEAYGIDVKLVEFVHDNGRIVRMCAPEFEDEE